jgi:hypothetical protein
MHSAALLAGAVVVAAACGTRGDAPLAPGLNHNVALVLEGTLTSSCEVQSFQSCPEAPFGTGITPGTPVSLRITYDSATPPTSILHLDNLEVVRYFSVTARLTVGGVELPLEASSATYIEISATPDHHTMLVTMGRGFGGGQLAGLSVDYAIAELRIAPSRYPDVSPPTSAAAFADALSDDPFTIALKHHTDPELASFGLTAPGSIVIGEIRSVRE